MIRITPYTPAHANGVIDVILPIQQQEFGVAVTLQDQPDLLDIPGFYQRNAGNFWVALDDDAVVGTIALLDTLLDWRREQGLREIFLGTTEQFLAAHRFYEKNGFSEIDKALLPPAFPRMAVDSKFYKRAH